jgi:hypothetical protein
VNRLVTATAALVLLIGLAGCGSSTKKAAADGTALVGTFVLTAGRCGVGTPTGTYFRMIQPGGTVATGKFFSNPDSACRDKSFTVERGGTDHGLITDTYQPGPARPFDPHGNARATRIVAPGSFTAINFAIATSPTDPQTGKKVAAPHIVVNDARLSGQISAWSASWNNLYFNQGSPKPDGSRPGLTTPVAGTYDARTHAFVLTWASQIVGGPFNGFSGYWHLQGTFEPRNGS